MGKGDLNLFDLEIAFVQLMPEGNYITQCDIEVSGEPRSIQLNISKTWVDWIATNIALLYPEFSQDLIEKLKIPLDKEKWLTTDIGFLKGQSLYLSGKAKIDWDVEYCDDPKDAEFYELVHIDGVRIEE